ncbi:MAG: type VI secretion system accessory protein TagJ [Pseudomonadota bacterium]
MDAKDAIRAGKLSEARKILVDAVKASPSDLGSRTLLFQVLCFCGDWDKAERHLDVIASQDPVRETGVQVYKNLVHAEKSRLEVLNGLARPDFLPDIPPYAEEYFLAREKVLQKKSEEAMGFFDEIHAGLASLSGNLDGRDFQGFKDSDTLLSPFLETIIHERYVWVPLEAVRELVVTPPKTLFDLLWIPAHITAWEGLTLQCYLPVLYPGSFSHEDDRVKLGRMTDWIPLGGPLARGMGQHDFDIGGEEISILSIGDVVFYPADRAGKDEEGA